jgi:TPR repeat protein
MRDKEQRAGSKEVKTKSKAKGKAMASANTKSKAQTKSRTQSKAKPQRIDPAALLARCDDTFGKVVRGDAMIGILPMEAVDQMAKDYRAVGEAGVAEGFIGLARCAQRGYGVRRSTATAMQALCSAAALGSRDALTMIRGMLPIHRGAEEDDPKNAKDAYAAAKRAKKDDEDGASTMTLALCAYHGFGTPRDAEAALMLHEAAATLGNADAMFELYAMISTGQGTTKDEKRALAWCVKAANQGHARAAYNLGAFYATGRGVEQDEAESRRWYARASEAGNGRATATLALMVAQGSGGERDLTRARELFDLADEQGADTAQLRALAGVDA